MKMIYYITRTLPGDGTGGALIRQGTVRFLRDAGYEVIIVALSDKTEDKIGEILVRGVSSRLSIRFNMILYKLGFIDDYLEPWSKRVFRKLKDRVKKEDIVLATSGGELGTLMVAKQLKGFTGCRAVYNLHDPVDFTTIDGEFSFVSSVKMRARDKAESKLFHSADAIVTSSLYYADALRRKYPDLSPILSCHHFGYLEKLNPNSSYPCDNHRINVVYGGNMGPLQGPEILIKLAAFFPDVDFTFVGNLTYNGEVPDNVDVKPKMAYKDYVNYLSEHADIGFFSLVGNVSKLCVPSKLYEYINVGVPVLAAIGGDSRTIVNDNGFGIATDYSIDCLRTALSSLLQPGVLFKAREALSNERDKWFMQYTIKELIKAF